MKKQDIEIISVLDLLAKEFPATDSMLGAGLLDRGGATLISGPQKVGKSLFATQLALSLADREPYLGFKCGSDDYRVLILQAEVAPKRMQERFAKQRATFSYKALERVLSASVFSSVKLDSDEGQAMVAGWVQQYKPDLLIVDPLSNFHTGDENTAQDMSKVISVLDGIRQEGVAVVLVHHHGKGSAGKANVGHKARGSSALPGWYDSHLSLEWAEPQKTVRLCFELRHAETPEDLILKLNPETLLFELQSDEAAQISNVVAAVREIGPATAEEVGARCHKTRQWASDWLNNAVDQAKLIRSSGRPVKFSLAGQPAGTRVDINPDGIVVSTNTAGDVPIFVDGEEIGGEEAVIPFR
jgi:KaiC/GvpD/RAD55 family RecA-like ATPase